MDTAVRGARDECGSELRSGAARVLAWVTALGVIVFYVN